MDTQAVKPRMKVDLKTVILLLTFLGFTTLGSLWTFSQRMAFFFLAGAFQEVSAKDSIRTLGMIHVAVTTAADSLKTHADARFDRLENYVTKIKDVQKAFTDEEKAKLRADREALERRRIFPINP